MPKPYEVTMTDEQVVLYVYDQLDEKKFTRRNLDPSDARELARELGIHADDVDDVAKDAQEQMA